MSKLRDIRLAAGLTMQQIVTKSGLARITVENAEKGRTVALVSAVRIVKALNELSGESHTVESLDIKTPEQKKEASD
jgi:transcriptional regulator with XRE-family HTH domain